MVTRSIRLKWNVIGLLILVVLLSIAFWMRPVSFYTAFAQLRMWSIGAKSNDVSVAGLRVHYYVVGPQAGQAVVLVHGLGSRSEDWRFLAPYLAKAGFRVYLPDLPGYGRSDRPGDFSYSIPAEAAVVVAFLDALALNKVDLGGWSMGGWIAQRIAVEHPERLRRLMLFDSAGINERPAWDTRLFTPTTAREVVELEVLLMPDPPSVPDFVAQDILRNSRDHAWVIHRAIDSMLLGHDTSDDLLPRLKMPVLIVWGSEDHLTPLSQGQKMHNLIPQSQLEVIPGCGHLAPGQCASQIGPKVVDFLKQ
jgi:pimeloyl-ACP methyl ester carboxylesterase